MTYVVQVVPSALKALQRLARPDQHRISKAIESLTQSPHPAGSKKLAGEENYWRIRVGDYRVIYTTEHGKLLVLVVKIGHRRDVYR
jgi:mRNA interferase RelE/StbE